MSVIEQAVVRMFNNYVEGFQKLDPRSVAPYCNIPCMFIAPQGVRVMTTSAEVESLLSAMMAVLKSRDYARSEIDDMRMSVTGDASAIVSVRRIRYRTSGEELERLGETYTLRKVDSEWKIVVAMVHDSEAVLSLA